jgi:hypothetical protein
VASFVCSKKAGLSFGAGEVVTNEIDASHPQKPNLGVELCIVDPQRFNLVEKRYFIIVSIHKLFLDLVKSFFVGGNLPVMLLGQGSVVGSCVDYAMHICGPTKAVSIGRPRPVPD